MPNRHLYPTFRGFLSGFCKLTCIGLLTSMLVIIVMQVMLRNLFHISMPWAQELTLYLMIYLALFGSAFVLYEKGHLRVDSLVEHLSPSLQRIIRLFIFVIQIAFFTTVIWFSIISLSAAERIQAVSLGISMLIPYLALPIAFGLMLLETFFQMFDELRGEAES